MKVTATKCYEISAIVKSHTDNPEKTEVENNVGRKRGPVTE